MVTLKPESVSRKNVIFGSHNVHCTTKMFFPSKHWGSSIEVDIKYYLVCDNEELG